MDSGGIALAATVGHAAQLLVLDVDQRSVIVALVASDQFACGPVHVRQAVEPAAHQHRAHSRGRQAQRTGMATAPSRLRFIWRGVAAVASDSSCAITMGHLDSSMLTDRRHVTARPTSADNQPRFTSQQPTAADPRLLSRGGDA